MRAKLQPPPLRRSGLPEHYELVIESEGRIKVPDLVQEALELQPGDFLSLTRNEISLRLDLYKELVHDLQRSVKPENRRRCLEQFSSQPRTAVGANGEVAIPSHLLALSRGDRVILEVITHGLGHTLYLFRAMD